MQAMLRPIVVGVAFAAIVAGGVTALTLRGETKEAGFVENACVKAAWPLIPAKCLEGSRGAEVRVIGSDTGSDAQVAATTMAERFNADFE